MAVSIEMEKYIFPWSQQLQIAEIYPIETKAPVHKIYVKMFYATLFMVAKTGIYMNAHP